MAEFDAHTSIEDAISAGAKGLVKKSADGDQSVEYHALKDLIDADKYITGKAAAAKAHFGLRMTQCVPPGGG